MLHGCSYFHGTTLVLHSILQLFLEFPCWNCLSYFHVTTSGFVSSPISESFQDSANSDTFVFYQGRCSAPTWTRSKLQYFVHFVSHGDFLTKLANQNFCQRGVLTVTDLHSDAIWMAACFNTEEERHSSKEKSFFSSCKYKRYFGLSSGERDGFLFRRSSASLHFWVIWFCKKSFSAVVLRAS